LKCVFHYFLRSTLDPRILIFANTKVQVNRLTELLSDSGFGAIPFHGDLAFHARQHSLAQFRSGRVHILIATNVAARGLDIKNISHVINFDMADTADDYVHRIGRTGRAGTSGVALSFVSLYKDSDIRVHNEIRKNLGLTIHPFDYSKLLLPQ
jgi:ATP-dependent RNA helicase RhlE